MTRKRLRMDLITHKPTRLTAFKKRKASIFEFEKQFVQTAPDSGLTICTASIEGMVPEEQRDVNFVPSMTESESGEKDESFDVDSFLLWSLSGDEKVLEFGETSNIVNLPSLPDWSLIEKDISESEKNHQISKSNSILTSLPDWWNEEDYRDDLASSQNSEFEKNDQICESSSSDEEIMGMLSYYV